MNLQEIERERIVAHVTPDMASYIAHDLYRQFAGFGVSVRYTEKTVEVSAEYITVAVEAWLQVCEHVSSFDRHGITKVMAEKEEN